MVNIFAKEIGSNDNFSRRFDLSSRRIRTLLDDSLASTVFDQRHGVKNITVGKKTTSTQVLSVKCAASLKPILEVKCFYSTDLLSPSSR